VTYDPRVIGNRRGFILSPIHGALFNISHILKTPLNDQIKRGYSHLSSKDEELTLATSNYLSGYAVFRHRKKDVSLRSEKQKQILS